VWEIRGGEWGGFGGKKKGGHHKPCAISKVTAPITMTSSTPRRSWTARGGKKGGEERGGESGLNIQGWQLTNTRSKGAGPNSKERGRPPEGGKVGNRRKGGQSTVFPEGSDQEIRKGETCDITFAFHRSGEGKNRIGKKNSTRRGRPLREEKMTDPTTSKGAPVQALGPSGLWREGKRGR